MKENWDKQLRKVFGDSRDHGISWRTKTRHKSRFIKPATLDDIVCYIKEYLLMLLVVWLVGF